ncbi:MAG: hypothetical protein L6Q75_02250 [Burkholderiaceae bacterium]|nr:hypothetical protein [Burkholderiaceae bacterium]
MRRFITDRWQGRVPPGPLLWRDMLLAGSAVNLACSLAALGWLAQGGSGGVAATLHFLPLPYNLFLWASLWRHPARSALQVLLGTLWAAVMVVA